MLQCVYNELNETISEDALKHLTAAHYKKIDLCDAIYIVDIDGYIGTAVKAEILYAKKTAKNAFFIAVNFNWRAN